MEYDINAIIVEMLARIQKLEEQVRQLSPERTSAGPERTAAAAGKKVTTADIRNYIETLKCLAAENGETELTLISGDIHREMKLQSRLPMVCNAMRQAMGAHDTILKQTDSGYSSTLKVKYDLSDRKEDTEMILDWNGDGRIDPVDIGVSLASIEEERGDRRESEVAIVYGDLVESFRTRPRDVHTVPRYQRTPVWFYTSVDRNVVYVEAGREGHEPKSKLSGRYPLEESEFETMLAFYQRFKRGKNVREVYEEAKQFTRCQVYWYGIFADLGI